MIYNNETNSEIILDESAQSNMIAKGIFNDIEKIKKIIKDKDNTQEFSKESYVSTMTLVKRILSTVLSFVGTGVKGAAVTDTGLRIFKANKIKMNTGTAPITKSKLIRNIIQFVVGILLKFLSDKIEDSVSEDMIKSCKVSIEELKKIRDKTDDKSTAEYIDSKIDELETRLKQYEEAK